MFQTHLNKIKCCFEKNGILFFIALIFLSLTACKLNPEKELPREWFVTESKLADFDYGSGDRPASVFRFYEDGTYSEFCENSSFSFGQWKFDKPARLNSMHQLSGDVKQKDNYFFIEYMLADRMKISLYNRLPVRTSKEQLEYTLTPGVSSSMAEDPYVPAMHQWRIPPAGPETDPMISQRAKSYLLFLEKLYKHAIKNNIKSLKSDWYPNPVKMHYGNGVQMARADELDDWYKCFYDTAQAVKGYQCISGPFFNSKLKHSSNKFERNLDLVEQLLQDMKSPTSK